MCLQFDVQAGLEKSGDTQNENSLPREFCRRPFARRSYVGCDERTANRPLAKGRDWEARQSSRL